MALGCGWTCGIEAITTVEVANGGGVWRWRMVEGEVEGEVAVEVQMRWRWRWSMAHVRWLAPCLHYTVCSAGWWRMRDGTHACRAAVRRVARGPALMRPHAGRPDARNS